MFRTIIGLNTLWCTGLATDDLKQRMPFHVRPKEEESPKDDGSPKDEIPKDGESTFFRATLRTHKANPEFGAFTPLRMGQLHNTTTKYFSVDGMQ